MDKIKNHVEKYIDAYVFLGLCVFFFFIFFFNNWSYMLMDVDESRYVSMSRDMWLSKDFLTLYLNHEFFFEKPPLYFWSECLAFGLFGKITEGIARFPVALYGTLTCIFVYLIGKKVVSRKYGIISSLILATSLEFVILAKFAILDIVLSAMVTFSVGFGMLTFYVQEKNKKFCWWLFYVFCGLAVMAKGIPGFVIPFGSMFFLYAYKRNLKEIFKPLYLLPGVIIFLLIVLPWHIAMINLHGQLFIDEYIIKHHLARFLGSNELGRQQPFYFYLLTVLWGLIPWIFSVLAVVIRKITLKDVKLTELNPVQTFLMYCGIISVFIMCFFSASSTKLITYILPIYPYLAFLCGHIWLNYAERGAYKNVINKTVYVIGGTFITASVVALFTQIFLPETLNSDISIAKPLIIPLLFVTGVMSVFFAKKEKFLAVFFTYVLFVTVLSAFGTSKIFEVDYKFGQNDLLEFSKYANEHNKSVNCLGFDRKYSVLYYAKNSVKYKRDYNTDDVLNSLNVPDSITIIKNKDITEDISKLDYNVISTGRKYTLIEKK